MSPRQPRPFRLELLAVLVVALSVLGPIPGVSHGYADDALSNTFLSRLPVDHVREPLPLMVSAAVQNSRGTAGGTNSLLTVTNRGTIEGFITPASNQGHAPLLLVNGTAETVLGNGAFSASEIASGSPYNVTAELSGYESSTHFVNVTPGNTTWTNFTLLPNSPPALYNVTFVETGMATGTNWSIDLNGTVRSSTTTAINFTRSDGTYVLTTSIAYRQDDLARYLALDPPPIVTVGGQGLTVQLDYITQFWVDIGTSGGGEVVVTAGASSSSVAAMGWYGANTSLVLRESPNASWTFEGWRGSGVGSYTGTEPDPTIGVFGSVSETAVFTRIVPVATFDVTFSETGLPSGTTWSVTFNKTSQSRTGSISFTGFPNGSYAFSVGTISIYAANPASGSVMIAGSSIEKSVTFSATSSPPGGGTNSISQATLLGLPLIEGYALVGAIAAVVVVGIAVAVLRGRGKGRQPSLEPASAGGAREETPPTG
jgi:hypothetical protein